MNKAIDDLPDAIRRQAERILYEIEKAGSMIVAVKGGAKATGFVLGVMCADGAQAERCEFLSAYFDAVTEKKLRSLTLGI